MKRGAGFYPAADFQSARTPHAERGFQTRAQDEILPHNEP